MLEYDVQKMTKEELHRVDLEKLALMRPMDDDLMRMMFRNNMPLAQMVLRILTGINDLVLTDNKTQYDLKHLLGARSICLDVFASDSKGVKYDLEIQRADKGASPKRARYHSSALDTELLFVNEDFENLPTTYTIFITENDVRGGSRASYFFERRDTETNEPLGDDEYILFINGAYNNKNDNSDLAKLIHDFGCTKPSEMYFSEMSESARKYKETEEGVSEMCKMMEDMRNNAEKAGVIKTLIELVRDGILSLAEAAKRADMTVDEFEKISGLKA